MALKRRATRRFWSRLHFLIRFLGLTGLLAMGAGMALAFLLNVLDWPKYLDQDWLQSVLLTDREPFSVRVGVGLLVGGAAVAAFALLIELLLLLFTTAGRRSAFGVNVALQTAAAAALIVGLNWWSFGHFLRYDWTRDRQFTLPAEIRSQLSQLQGQTTIVVYQRHKTFGSLSDKPDAYDYAAERNVVEKVKDLIEQFREFGPQFRVVVLDVEEEGYGDKLEGLTKDNPALRVAIDQAPENSIFFATTDQVQRLSFNDFYQLDKTASQEANGGKGNLVLLFQGVAPFARKVLNVDERRPRIGVAVVHEWLTTEGLEDYGLGGFRKALMAQGFDVKDVVLKRWSQIAPPEPAVYSYEESKLDRLEERLALIDASLKSLNEQSQELSTVREFWKTAKLDEITKKYEDQLRGRKVTEEMRRINLEEIEDDLASLQMALGYNKKRRDAVAEDRGKLNVDSLAEQRRIADLKAKMTRALADVDVLIVPRMTLRNVSIGDYIPSQVYRLDDSQVDAIKDFLKSGRPVLALFGPSNESPERGVMPARGPDLLEDLFAKLGIKFGKQTVLFDVESESFAERRTGLQIAGINTEVPPVEFEGRPGAGRPLGMAQATATLPPNPIRESMRLTNRSLGKNRTLDLRLRHPRPVYFDPPPGVKADFEPDILMASAASWNEDQPFPTNERTPRFERPKNDPAKGTLDEKRRGPFPVGIAVEEKLPADWYDKDAAPATVRLVALGHGGLFGGAELAPAKEKLAVNTLNWLLGRDDLLPKAETVWEYPRVTLDEKPYLLWRWGGWLALPFLFTYLGLVVLLARRLR